MSNPLTDDQVSFEKSIQEQLDALYIKSGYTVDRSGSCREFDCVINGKKVEEKIRTRVYPDILLEFIQDIPSQNTGWFFDTRCDRLHYVFTKDNQIVFPVLGLKWESFKKWYLETYLAQRRFGNYQISGAGYGLTLNLILRLTDIPEKYIYHLT